MYQCFYIFTVQKQTTNHQKKPKFMNSNCLSPDQSSFVSPVFKDRGNNIGKNFVYTVLVFLALCLVSYVVHA